MGIVVSLEARRRGRPAERGDARVERARTSFYFDLADPGTYLAAERVDRLFEGVDWRPASLSALLAARAPVPAADDAEVAARAEALHMPLVWPERHPEPRPAAMRVAAYAAEHGRGGPFVLAASRLAFCGGFDLDDPEVLAEAAAAAGLGLRDCLRAAGDPARDEAIEREAHRLLGAGAERLPVVRVGRLLFAGEERVAAAAAAWRDPAPLRQQA
jgi:2-hydroxychromene-2-carboxylate isomerase